MLPIQTFPDFLTYTLLKPLVKLSDAMIDDPQLPTPCFDDMLPLAQLLHHYSAKTLWASYPALLDAPIVAPLHAAIDPAQYIYLQANPVQLENSRTIVEHLQRSKGLVEAVKEVLFAPTTNPETAERTCMYDMLTLSLAAPAAPTSLLVAAPAPAADTPILEGWDDEPLPAVVVPARLLATPASPAKATPSKSTPSKSTTPPTAAQISQAVNNALGISINPRDPVWTDSGSAQAILNRLPVKWVDDFEFYVYTGKSWEPQGKCATPSSIVAVYYQLANDLQDYADTLTDTLPKVAKSLVNWAFSMKSTSKTNSVFSALKIHTSTRSTSFNKNGQLLNLQNGTYNWQTRTLKPHDAADMLSTCMPVSYNPAAPASAPLFEDALLKFTGNVADANFLKEYLGASLAGKPATSRRTCLFLLGDTSNGKSLFQTVLRAALGDLVGTTTVKAILTHPSAPVRDPNAGTSAFEVLRGKRLAIMSEAPKAGGFLGDAFKSLTGDNAIVSRGHIKAFTEIPNIFSCIVDTNVVPAALDADPAVMNRVKILKFVGRFLPDNHPDHGKPGVYRQDPHIHTRICGGWVGDKEVAGELDGVFALLVQGLNSWLDKGERFVDTPSMIANHFEWIEGSSPFLRFMSDTYQISQTPLPLKDRLQAGVVLNTYKLWQELHLGKQDAFPSAVGPLKDELAKWRGGVVETKSGGIRSFAHLALKKHVELEDPDMFKP